MQSRTCGGTISPCGAREGRPSPLQGATGGAVEQVRAMVTQHQKPTGAIVQSCQFLLCGLGLGNCGHGAAPPTEEGPGEPPNSSDLRRVVWRVHRGKLSVLEI